MATSPALATIIGGLVSPYVRKVLAVCEMKGVPCQVDPIVPFFGDEEFSELNPLRRVPVFIDDQVSVCEHAHPRIPGSARGARWSTPARRALAKFTRIADRLITPPVPQHHGIAAELGLPLTRATLAAGCAYGTHADPVTPWPTPGISSPPPAPPPALALARAPPGPGGDGLHRPVALGGDAAPAEAIALLPAAPSPQRCAGSFGHPRASHIQRLTLGAAPTYRT